ncbi:MAG: hypothetical protein BAA00_01330 [Parageobacillus thermoglucosidasius]|nr:MAG: hypothetical protein BAA00_01330 [Parageobacillus thermoglucosidasius]
MENEKDVKSVFIHLFISNYYFVMELWMGSNKDWIKLHGALYICSFTLFTRFICDDNSFTVDEQIH